MAKPARKREARLARRANAVDERAVSSRAAKRPGSSNSHKQSGGHGRRSTSQVKADSRNAVA